MKTEYKDLIIETFTEETLDKMLGLSKEIVNLMQDKSYYDGPSKESCLKIIENKNNLLIGIYNKQTKELMGYATITNYDFFENIDDILSFYNNSKKEEIAYFRNVAVHPNFRGQKILKKIEEFFTIYSKNKGFKYIAAYVHPDNKFSKDNFVNNGYEVISQIIFDNGSPRDVLAKKL
jgi:ribosomal protein S18 acetylase RimI-like enzyme